METIDRINKLLKERGMSGAELSRAIGVSSAVYSQWNTRKTTPSNKNIARVAAVLKVPVSDLIGEEQKEKHPAQGGVPSEKDMRLIEWFRSLPPEKQKAILISQDAPKELID